MQNLYYDPPTDKIFEEVKEAAISIWNSYEDERYRSEKVGMIVDLKNISDNVMYIVGMFDLPNQMRLSARLSDEAKKAIGDRIFEGGGGTVLNPFYYE